jgi:hypothetical protein
MMPSTRFMIYSLSQAVAKIAKAAKAAIVSTMKMMSAM